jgi:hypothetical protein
MDEYRGDRGSPNLAKAKKSGFFWRNPTSGFLPLSYGEIAQSTGVVSIAAIVVFDDTFQVLSRDVILF